eukprot:g7552.t2
MDDASCLDDPSAAARRNLAAEDQEYWAAHPEIPGLVAHFMAKVLEQRPSNPLAFARETLGHRNLKEQVEQAIARNGGIFNGELQRRRQKAPGTASKNRGGGKGRTSRERAPQDNKGQRDGGSREKDLRDEKGATR